MPGQKKKKPFRFPVTTLVGSSIANFRAVTNSFQIDDNFRKRYLLSLIASMILDPIAKIERISTRKKVESIRIERPPVFIIGYWRSGTTFLHTCLCRDPNAAYVNTFQGIFPNHVLLNKGWISFLARFLMPPRRPVDDVRLDMDLPQEEEIAMGNLQYLSFYNFFYFPRDILRIRDESLLFKDVSEKQLMKWKESYEMLIKRAILNTGGKQFISKSPPNTFRIPYLLDMFPGARFIFLYRDPERVLSSFRLFATEVAKGIGLQNITAEEYEKPLCDLYRDLMIQYEKDRELIPPDSLVEIRYRDLMKDPIGHIRQIYDKFDLGEPDIENIREFIREKPPGSTSKYEIPQSIKDYIEKELSGIVKRWGLEKD